MQSNNTQLTELDIKFDNFVLESTQMDWSTPSAMKFLIRRQLHGDELKYQEINAAGKVCKKTIGLIERSMKQDTEKARVEQVKEKQTQLNTLKQEQRLIDSKLVDCRNPDSKMLSTYIDLHGCGKEQGARILYNHLTIVQQSLIAKALTPNFNETSHVFQIITGEGKLNLAMKDFLAIAGYDFHASQNGAFLVRLGTSQAEANAREARVSSNKAMLDQQKEKWTQAKLALKLMKRQTKDTEKIAKFEAKHGMTWDQKQEQKAAKKAAKAERQAEKEVKQIAKAEFKAEKHAAKEQRKAEKGVKAFSFEKIINSLQKQGFNQEQIASMQMAIENVTPQGDTKMN